MDIFNLTSTFKNAEKLIRLDFRFKKKLKQRVEEKFGEHLKDDPVSICVRFYNDSFDYPNCSNNHRNIEMEYFDREIH